MTNDQFCSVLTKLRLKPASQHSATAFGLSLRQLQRVASGHAPVPRPVALLAIA
jgi:hypothetical protein